MTQDPKPPTTSTSTGSDWITTYETVAFMSEPFPLITKKLLSPRSKLSTPWWQKLDVYQWWMTLGEIWAGMETKGALDAAWGNGPRPGLQVQASQVVLQIVDAHITRNICYEP